MKFYEEMKFMISPMQKNFDFYMANLFIGTQCNFPRVLLKLNEKQSKFIAK